ncbi:hypothetical protein MTP99_016542 [Tenebrio molitor]|nr:hypothetical protein MTP99_016542 [Tenebrio molitor]
MEGVRKRRAVDAGDSGKSSSTSACFSPVIDPSLEPIRPPLEAPPLISHMPNPIVIQNMLLANFHFQNCSQDH